MFFPGSSDGEHDENMDENISDEGESDNEVKPVSKRKQLKDKKGRPKFMEESDEEKPDAGGRIAEDTERSLQDVQISDEEKRHSEDEHEDELSEASGEQAKEEETTDSEDDLGDQARVDEKTDSEDNQVEQTKEEEKTDSEDNQEKQAKEEEKTDSEDERTDSEDNQRDQVKEEEKPDSEDNQEKNDVGTSPVKPEKPHKEPPNPSAAGDDELPDDEPLVFYYVSPASY